MSKEINNTKAKILKIESMKRIKSAYDKAKKERKIKSYIVSPEHLV